MILGAPPNSNRPAGRWIPSALPASQPAVLSCLQHTVMKCSHWHTDASSRKQAHYWTKLSDCDAVRLSYRRRALMRFPNFARRSTGDLFGSNLYAAVFFPVKPVSCLWARYFETSPSTCRKNALLVKLFLQVVHRTRTHFWANLSSIGWGAFAGSVLAKGA